MRERGPKFIPAKMSDLPYNYCLSDLNVHPNLYNAIIGDLKYSCLAN